MEDSKLCTCCKIIKPLSEFSARKTSPTGKHTQCKACKKAKYSYEPQQTGEITCTKCGERKSVTEFSPHKSYKTGRRPYCKNCQQDSYNEWASTFDGFIGIVFNSVKTGAKDRKLSVEITKKDIYDLYETQGGKCAISGIKMTHIRDEKGPGYTYNISVDRVDSSKGYTKDNIHLVCSVINQMKWDTPLDVFNNLCKRIVEFDKLRLEKSKI